jgi:hypothetical protein
MKWRGSPLDLLGLLPFFVPIATGQGLEAGILREGRGRGKGGRLGIPSWSVSQEERGEKGKNKEKGPFGRNSFEF